MRIPGWNADSEQDVNEVRKEYSDRNAHYSVRHQYLLYLYHHTNKCLLWNWSVFNSLLNSFSRLFSLPLNYTYLLYNIGLHIVSIRFGHQKSKEGIMCATMCDVLEGNTKKKIYIHKAKKDAQTKFDMKQPIGVITRFLPWVNRISLARSGPSHLTAVFPPFILCNRIHLASFCCPSSCFNLWYMIG